MSARFILEGRRDHGVLLVSGSVLCFLCPFSWRPNMGVCSGWCLFPSGTVGFHFLCSSTAINPADPGIMSKFDPELMHETKEKHESNAHGQNRKFDEVSNGTHSCASSASRSSFAGANSSKKDCRKQDEAAEQDATGEDALFCTLCNAEVRKFSKHCRSCDKCVDGFDHHCRLVIEAGVGIGVLVRCFVNKSHMEAEIVDRLGNGFSRAPFATVVAICTAVSLLACVPLGELFFFHMILIRKGITTYEYVVAMRAMSEAPAGASVDEELPNILYSPSGSATTGFSGGSSLGLQYKGAWCTPPRVFVDYQIFPDNYYGIKLLFWPQFSFSTNYCLSCCSNSLFPEIPSLLFINVAKLTDFFETQEEVAPQLGPGMVPSTIDPDAAGLADKLNKGPKKGVRISAWKLAKLDSNEAVKAAAKARASSSVLRPLDNRRLPDSELSSSENA
ncbi:hypothetical protein DH2020_025045 [Rehmannia glutinosa]|uniref:S-acyltransferase n=1 Tax=Rehmannia glutinosa TaxID=99300 RepID=A0ABR0W558_REHGL